MSRRAGSPGRIDQARYFSLVAIAINAKPIPTNAPIPDRAKVNHSPSPRGDASIATDNRMAAKTLDAMLMKFTLPSASARINSERDSEALGYPADED